MRERFANLGPLTQLPKHYTTNLVRQVSASNVGCKNMG